MYPPATFSSADLDQALEIARRTKFSTLATYHDAEIVIVHIPVTLVERTSEDSQQDVKFLGHIMKTNPFYDLLAAGDIDAKMTFLPANGYISPSVYAEKRVSGKVVPTWNYVAAHFNGSMHLEDELHSLRHILDAQTKDFEEMVSSAWQVSDAPSDYIGTLSKSIAGFSFKVSSWNSVRKLSQNKPDERASVAQWVAEVQTPYSSLSSWMQEALEK